ncbi:MAG: phosphotransferase [Oscillospiraceae bacterium]|nr:phosphotransferase [Oscillospiraceae bacterium]
MENIINTLNEHYPIHFDRLELLREGGSKSYAAFFGNDKYFLRVIYPAFFDTAVTGADIQVFLQNKGFPVPLIIFTKGNLPYIKITDSLLILYEFIEGADCDPEQDAEAIGGLLGRFHHMMKEYPGKLVKRNKQFYIGRYIDILRKLQYPRTDEYIVYGDDLWEKIKDLPMGYCHGDMYDGNIRKTPDGNLYIHDFDTSCEGFPMYDPTLICDMTSHFDFDERNYDKSNKILSRFVPEYRKFNALSQAETDAFHALIAIQHYSTQATVMEIAGLDCIDSVDMDNQLEWLYRWRKQCDENKRI